MSVSKHALVAQLRERARVLRAYLLMKVDEEDWHGVSDAANDMRELVLRIAAAEEDARR